MGAFSDHYTFDYLNGGKASEFSRKLYLGNFVSCGGYTAQGANQTIEENSADLIAIGGPLIANPGYIQKIKKGQELTQYDKSLLGRFI